MQIQAQGDMRPMQGRDGVLEEIEQMLEARSSLYAQAQLHLNTDMRTISELTDRVVRFYRNDDLSSSPLS